MNAQRYECVVDTTILFKANAPIVHPGRAGSLFQKRLRLLSRIQEGELVVLVSSKLVNEYKRKIPLPRNDYIRTFFELINDPQRCTWNWKRRWTGSDRSNARSCRYPQEDDHLLRTAIRPTPTTLFSEEQRICAANPCIYRRFRVHLSAPD